MVKIKLNNTNVVFTKTFKGLDSEILDMLAEANPDRVVFIDTAPMAGLMQAIDQVRGVVRNAQVILRDHHDVDGEPSTERDEQIRAAAVQVREMLGSNAHISNRRKSPACSSLIEFGEFAGEGTVIIADPDPDGLTASMKAVGITYDSLDSDAAILDGPRVAQTVENGLSEVAMLLVKSMATLPPYNPNNPVPSEKAKAELFGTFASAAGGDADARQVLTSKVKVYEAGVAEAERLAATAIEAMPGVILVDVVGQPRHDLATLAAKLEARDGCKVTVVRKDSGPIAVKHDGIQLSLAVPRALQKEVNLQDFLPAGFTSSPEEGIISNTSFLLHVSETVYTMEVFPAMLKKL